jgi:cytochrome c-type biogenesis protein CcmE
MTSTAKKFIAGGVILLGAVAYLAYAGLSDGLIQYHLQVDEFVNTPKYHTQRVRLCGKVAEGGLVSSPGQLSAKFTLLGEKQQVPVAYSGVIPDLFKAGGEVIVEGRLDSAGTFQADVLLTKCASKYQAADHGKKKGA